MKKSTHQAAARLGVPREMCHMDGEKVGQIVLCLYMCVVCVQLTNAIRDLRSRWFTWVPFVCMVRQCHVDTSLKTVFESRCG